MAAEAPMNGGNDNITNLYSARPSGNGPGNGGNAGERLARLEANMGHLATKADLGALKSDLLKWQIGILITVVIASCLGTAALIVNIMMP